MARKSLNLKWGILIGLALCVITPTTGLLPETAEAQLSDVSLRTTSLSYDGQNNNDLSGTAPARDAFTYSEDKSLTNACIDSGKDKAECLCVTRVLKYELSVREYKAASILVTGQAKQTPTSLRASRLMLESQGYSDSEINGLERMNASLTRAPDFAARCADALLYFNGKQTG